MTTPDELRAAFIKSRGLSLASNPVPAPPPVVVPPPQEPVTRSVQTIPITPTEAPIRTNPDGTLAGNITSNRVDNPASWVTPPVVAPAPDAAVVAAPPARVPPSAFPVGGVAPVPNTAPVIEQGAGGGVSLNSNPVAPGWAGTVGIPTSPEESKWWEKGAKNAEMMAGLEAMAKGARPKPAGDSGANTISPMSSLQPNAPGQLSSDLMQSILQNRRRKYGVSLAG